MTAAADLTTNAERAPVPRVDDAMVTVPKVHRAETRAGTVRGFFADDHVHMAVVVDDAGVLVGLLCLKRSGLGYCSDEGIRARERERSGVGQAGGPCSP